MSFLMLSHSTKTDVFEKRDKIAMVVAYCHHTYFVFFQDKSFLHYNRKNQTILYEGKLNFKPTKHLCSTVKGRLVLLGEDKDNNIQAACIKIQQSYLVQTRTLSNLKPEPSTMYYIFEPQSKENKTFYIIRILKNVENGISVEAFDFARNIWQEQMLHLGHKFLQSIFIDCSLNSQVYKEIGDTYCSAFTLLSPGDKYDSINYSKIKICHEQIETVFNLKLKFVITRELKLKSQHFVPIGGINLPENKIILIGNSKVEGANPNTNKHFTASLIFNTHQLEIDEPQQPRVKIILSNEVGPEDSILFRNIIGIFDKNILAVAKLPSKRWSIVKVSQKSEEILADYSITEPKKLEISILHDIVYSLQNQYEYFFQKFKNAPSKLHFNIFRLENKQLQYHKLLKQKYTKLDDDFADVIVSIL